MVRPAALAERASVWEQDPRYERVELLDEAGEPVGPVRFRLRPDAAGERDSESVRKRGQAPFLVRPRAA